MITTHPTWLTKAETVMDLVTPRHGRETSHAYFASRDDDTGLMHRSYQLPLEDWRDMGEPDTITVTAVPGDTLNAS
jgi:hypothetical protein